MLSVGTDRYGAWTGPRGWSLSLLVRWFQWGSFALLLFLWLGMVGEIAGLGRIRLVLGGLLALTFHPREYVAGVNTLLGRRAPRYALLMLVLMVASHWAWGTSDSLIVRNGVTDVAVMLWAVMLVRSSGDMVRFRKVFLGVVSVLALGGLAAFWRGDIVGELDHASDELKGDLAELFDLYVTVHPRKSSEDYSIETSANIPLEMEGNIVSAYDMVFSPSRGGHRG